MKNDQDLAVGHLPPGAGQTIPDPMTLATEVAPAGEATRGTAARDASGVGTLVATGGPSRGPEGPADTVAPTADDGTSATLAAGTDPAGGTSATIAFGAPLPGPALIAHLEGTGPGQSHSRYARTHMHARGGIGQVWLARDGDLGREVALKELRPEQRKNPNAWSRFVEEARITGQLEHPGIVPVYELATRPVDGKPFYTMRFIRGRTLSEAAREFREKKAAGAAGPLELASLLNAFVALCNTAGYAHSRGVIHRDLKGQNVVLGDFGEVMLLDWGIAKLVEVPAPGDGNTPGTITGTGNGTPVTLKDDGSAHEATVDGEIIGTPSYMAPEQAEGRIEAIDARTDVYGLGAILYEILAGRPPYEGTTTQEVLRKVIGEPPTPLRQVDPTTPKALEAICLKAMAKKPEGRYPSALALADEVRRWLADGPVSAYREPWTARVARWSKRHRTEVLAASALLVMAVVGLSASTVLVGRERDEARRQREQARKAVDDNYTRVAEAWMADGRDAEPGMAPRIDALQREFLEKALGYYRDFAGPDEGDPGLRQDQGRAHLRMGDVLRKLGRLDEAEPAYRRAIAAFAKLADDQPDVPEHRDYLAEATYRLGSERASRTKAADLDEAARLYRRAAEAQDALVAMAPTTPRRVALGRTLGEWADLLRVTGKPVDAEATYRRAFPFLERAAADEPLEAAPTLELAAGLDGLATLLRDRGRLDEAKATAGRSTEVFEKLVAEVPTLPGPRNGLARAYNNLALILRESAAPPAEAEAVFDKEVAQGRRLVEDFPGRTEYRRALARALMNLGIIYRESNRVKEADAAYSQALGLVEKLARDAPEVRKYARDLGHCLNNLGELRAARKGESEPLYRRALEVDRALVAESPGVPEHRVAVAGVLQNLGVWLAANKRGDEAVASSKEAVAAFEELALADPDDPSRRRGLARSLDTLGNAYSAAGRRAEAEEAYRRASNAFDLLVSRPGASSADRLSLAGCLSNRGTNQADGKLPGAEESLRRSLALLDALASEGPTSPAVRFRLAAARNNFGEWLASAGRPGDAEEAFRSSVALFAGLAAEFPNVAAYKSTLGQARASFGLFLVDQHRPDDASALLAEGIRDEKAALAPAAGPEAREPIRKHLATLAMLQLDRKAHAEVARAGEDLLKVAGGLPSARLEVARLMARCAPLAATDAALTPTRRALMAGAYADRAIALLREAIEGNDPEARRLLPDPAFDPIRDRDGFKALEPEKIGRLGRPGRPIA